jgi:hypothetical protein
MYNNLINMSNTSDNIFALPPNIPNVDYNQIILTYNSYSDVIVYLSKLDKYKKELDMIMTKIKSNYDLSDKSDSDIQQDVQILESPENNSEYARLIPPYKSHCAFSADGCLKMAAFKNMSNSKLFCWFHVNCQNN